MGHLGSALAELGVHTLAPFEMAAAQRAKTGGVMVTLRSERFILPEAAAQSLLEQLALALANHRAPV